MGQPALAAGRRVQEIIVAPMEKHFDEQDGAEDRIESCTMRS
jgi:hypothetical protein